MSDIAQHILSLFSLSPASNQSEANMTAPPTGTAAQPDLPSPLASELAALRAQVADILTVFNDPRFASLDTPEWVYRPSPLAHHARITVRGLVRALREIGADLGLVDGERYVLTAVCACADGTHCEGAGEHPLDTGGEAKTEAETEAEVEALARRLQRLASAWVAFLLWPCKSSRSIERHVPTFDL